MKNMPYILPGFTHPRLAAVKWYCAPNLRSDYHEGVETSLTHDWISYLKISMITSLKLYKVACYWYLNRTYL